MARTLRRPLALAGVLGLLASGAIAGAGPARAVSASAVSAGAVPASAVWARAVPAPRWHLVKQVKTDFSGDFTAVAATGKTTGWAFDGQGYTSPPAAYRLNGGRWRREPFPARENEQVITAAATSPTDVWAFTQGLSAPSRVLRYNGHAWSVAATFTAAIADATVLAPNDVWVYGNPAIPHYQASLGVWHYNGSSWRQVSHTIQGGSALSATSAWGFSGVDVEHWNGRGWLATSVRSLLPRGVAGGLNHPQVVGVLALSASNVYAIGNGTAQDEGGPVVVLHYNGQRWTRLATGRFGYGPGPEISSDGAGGLWLPMNGPVGGTSRLVHYTAGRLTPAALPLAAPMITIASVAHVPGTTGQLAGGYTHASGDRSISVTAVLLTYG